MWGNKGMKKKSYRMIGIVVMLFVAIFYLSGKQNKALAEVTSTSTDLTYGDYTYKILEDGTVSITGYKGNASELHMPDTINGKKVTVIGELAFLDKTKLTKVILPKELKIIEKAAFAYCFHLKEVKMFDGLLEIGPKSFLVSNLSNLSIPDTVKEIGVEAFAGNINLIEVKLSKQLKVIPVQAFFDCEKLSNVYIPESVIEIQEQAFGHCYNLHTLLSDKVFYTGKEFMIIPKSIKKIGPKIFKNCNIKNYIVLNKDCSIGYLGSIGNIYCEKDSPVYNYALCSGCYKEWKPVKKISLSKPTLDLIVNKKNTDKLTVTYAPKDSIIQQVIWSSSNPKVATVDQQGNVKAVGNGSAKITARTVEGSNISKSCTVNVQTEVTKVALNKSKVTLCTTGTKTIQLSASISPKNASNKKVTWKSSNTKVATVDSKGKVTAKGPGIVSITATSNNYKATCKVTVTPAAQKGLKAYRQKSNEIKLKWSKVAGVTGYSIYRYDGKQKKYVKIKDTKSNTYTVKKVSGSKGKQLASGTYYTFKVTPYKISENKKIYGTSAKVRTSTATKATTITKGTKVYKKGKCGITIKWKEISGATGYKVYLSTKKSSGYKCVKTLSGKKRTSYTKYGLSKNKTYYIKIRVLKKAEKTTIQSDYSKVKKVR